MKFILGTKMGMTQVFRPDGTVVPVTRVQAGPCVITQVKTEEKDGVRAVQVGFGTQKLFRKNKAEQGHLKGISAKGGPETTVRFLQDFRLSAAQEFTRGTEWSVTVFSSGDKVQVTGTSKGKGFQGVVKRHGFAGGPASHGHKDNLRMPGSIGAGGVQRVFKNMRMGGHMGDEQITVKNLEIIEVHPDTNELLVKGAVPGARGGLVAISGEGAMEINVVEVKEEPKEEAPVVETEPIQEEAAPVADQTQIET